MDENELVLRRTQIGMAFSTLASGDGMEYQVETGWWLGLMGASSPDLNLALLHQRDSSALAEVLRRVAARGCPALVMFAGGGRPLMGELPDGWEPAGTMPMMAVDLANMPTQPDARVRPAGPDDVETLTDLLAESYGMARATADMAMGSVVRGGTAMQAWLLEEDGQVVSTVSTCRVQDSVSVWMMGTPARFGRRGYGRALLASVLDHARNDGAKIGLLAAMAPGLPLYEATGWAVVDDWQIFANLPSAQFSQ
jgi:GNAT superfamily N-acetyltransferase